MIGRPSRGDTAAVLDGTVLKSAWYPFEVFIDLNETIYRLFGLADLALVKELGRYGAEAKRLYGVLDQRLATTAYLADEYSIADIATYPWVARHEWHRVDLAAFPNVRRWYDTIGRRPAVARGMAVPYA